MRKISFLSLLLLLLTLSSWGQYDARVQLSLGNFSPLDKNYKDQTFISCNQGVSIQQRVYKNFSLKLSYQRWYDLPDKISDNYSDVGVVNLDHRRIPSYAKGSVMQRMNYQMVDVSLSYNKNIGRHQEVYISAGASKAFGNDEVLDETLDLEVWNCIINTSMQKSSYWGAQCELGYNFYFLKHINIGPSVNFRTYRYEFNQYTLNFNVGYNFNFIKK